MAKNYSDYDRAVEFTIPVHLGVVFDEMEYKDIGEVIMAAVEYFMIMDKAEKKDFTDPFKKIAYDQILMANEEIDLPF